jgi:hypothetical protein
LAQPMELAAVILRLGFALQNAGFSPLFYL